MPLDGKCCCAYNFPEGKNKQAYRVSFHEPVRQLNNTD